MWMFRFREDLETRSCTESHTWYKHIHTQKQSVTLICVRTHTITLTFLAGTCDLWVPWPWLNKLLWRESVSSSLKPFVTLFNFNRPSLGLISLISHVRAPLQRKKKVKIWKISVVLRWSPWPPQAIYVARVHRFKKNKRMWHNDGHF